MAVDKNLKRCTDITQYNFPFLKFKFNFETCLGCVIHLWVHMLCNANMFLIII